MSKAVEVLKSAVLEAVVEEDYREAQAILDTLVLLNGTPRRRGPGRRTVGQRGSRPAYKIKNLVDMRPGSIPPKIMLVFANNRPKRGLTAEEVGEYLDEIEGREVAYGTVTSAVSSLKTKGFLEVKDESTKPFHYTMTTKGQKQTLAFIRAKEGFALDGEDE
jgi:hypothetical protein